MPLESDLFSKEWPFHVNVHKNDTQSAPIRLANYEAVTDKQMLNNFDADVLEHKGIL